MTTQAAQIIADLPNRDTLRSAKTRFGGAAMCERKKGKSRHCDL